MESELSLIGKVELRIALASDDAQLENSLKVYLPPLLLKLGSPYTQVRQAILKIIQYLIPRITASRSLKLPIDLLLDQVRQPKIPAGQDPSQVRLYSLLFISRGIDRLNEVEKFELIPRVIEAISTYPLGVAARLFNILCKLLLDTHKSGGTGRNDRNSRAEKWPKLEEADLKFVADCCTKFFLLQPIEKPVPLPGLTVQDTAFLTRDAGVTYTNQPEISQVKAVLLEFLQTPIFLAKDLRIPLLIASSDSSLRIKDPSEILFKKLNIDYEDLQFVDELFKYLVGVPQEEGEVRPAVKLTLQEQILTIFLKSRYASTHKDVVLVANIGFSSENARLKQSTVQFVRWVSRSQTTGISDSNVVEEFAGSMAAHLKSSLISEGWPKLDTSLVKNYSNAISQRQLKYEALGELLKLNPSLLSDAGSYIKFLFTCLEGEDVELRSTIQDSLSGLCVHLPNLSPEDKDSLKSLLSGYLTSTIINDNLQSCRYIAIKYIGCCFPFSDPEARYLCILGTSKENRSDTVEESLKLLNPYWYSILQASNTLEFKSTLELLGSGGQSVVFPDFNEMVSTIKQQKDTLLRSMGQAIRFLLNTLVMQSIKGKSTVVVVDEEWSTRLEKAIEVDETVQGLLRKEIKNLSRDETAGVHDIEMSDENGFTSDSGLFVSYLQLIFDAFSGQYFNSGIASDIIYGSTLTRLLSLSPTKGVVSKLATDSSREKYIDLLSMLLNDIALTELAQAIGIIFSSHAVSDADCVQLLSKLNEAPKAALGVKSKLIANAYLISRLSIRNRIHLLTSEFLSTYLSNVLKGLKEPQSYSLTLDCISQLSIFGVLAIQEHGALVAEIKEELLKRVKKGDENAVITLSYLSLVLPKEVKENDELTDLEKAVYDTHVTKQTEFIFSSGESLAILAAGWQSTILQRQLDIHDDNSIEIINRLIPEDTSRLPIILEMVFKSCANTKPSLRRSGCIWLLSLVQYVGHLKPIRDNAAKIHVSFMRFLADRDELIQELASRGLSLVYEMGDYDLKDTLVKGLLKSFTESGSTANNTGGGSVDLETQLFDPDVLKTNDGSISTYKDVLNLASDVGDPSLVYKFMSLAKSSSLWSSRKGMAFGLGSILSKTSLDEMLQNNKTLALRLIPKLYRYKFDPSTSVSKAMQDIWNVLIKDSLKTIDENLDNILQELLKSMGNKEWRVRQALTTALIDLLQVTTLDKYESKLEEIWNMSFRVMDDIKESVRKEGNKLTKSLATTITRRIEKSANSDTTSDKTRSSEFLSSLIPFLLGSKGLLSDAEDIRNFALETILKLVKVGGSTMKPFIPELIDNFINLMSTLEPQIVNYLVLNADKYNLKNDEIDARRLQSVGASPMMDAIEKMLDQVDDLMMDQFVSRLQSSIKKSIGLPLKVCGSKVLVLLVTRHLQLIKPYGDKLLKICINQIGDKNDTIALSYAASAGYLCRVCSTRAIVDYAQHLQKLYFDLSIGNERHRIVCSIASESVAKYSKDKFESIAKSFLPLAFLGKHDPLEVVKSNFEREWIENTSGNLSIKLYLPEIIELSQAHLNTSRLYEIRQVIASSIADLVSSIDIGSVEFANSTITSQLFELLLEGSKGKSWSGKEYIVEALVLFSIKCKPALLQDQDLLEKIEKTIIVEIKRRNKVYQKQVLKFAAKFIFNFNQKELISTYISIMEEFVSDRDDVDDSDDSDDDAMEIDSGSRNQKSNIDNSVKLEEQRLVLIKGLFESFNPKVQDDGDDSLAELVFKLIINLFQTPKFSKSWRSKLACCESILKVITEFSEDLTPTAIQFIFEDWEILSKNCLGLKDIENIKVNFIRLSKCVIGIVDDEKKNKVKSVLRDFKSNESSNVVITELNSVL